jgi:hypothetical protein
MWTDRVGELVEGLGRYALGKLGDVTTLYIASGRPVEMLFDFLDPHPSMN